MILVYFLILPGINFLYLSTKPSSDLKDALISADYLPADIDPETAITEDFMITAWDLNNRSPRFFTKKNAKKYTEENFNHALTLDQMTWASANTPYYFKPAEIKNAVYISGDNMAISPALFSYYYATEQMKKPENNIRIVSVGSINVLSEKIDTKASLLDWAVRLTSLSAPVKKHTMDYMAQHLLGQQGAQLHKYEIDQTTAWDLDFYNAGVRLPELKSLSQQLIFSVREDIEDVITQIVKERFVKVGVCNNRPLWLTQLSAL